MTQNTEMQTLIEKIENTPILYLGIGYYYSLKTDVLYVKMCGELVPQDLSTMCNLTVLNRNLYRK